MKDSVGWVMPWQNKDEGILPEDVMGMPIPEGWGGLLERMDDEAREHTSEWITEHGKMNPNMLIDKHYVEIGDHDIMDSYTWDDTDDIGDDTDEPDDEPEKTAEEIMAGLDSYDPEEGFWGPDGFWYDGEGPPVKVADLVKPPVVPPTPPVVPPTKPIVLDWKEPDDTKTGAFGADDWETDESLAGDDAPPVVAPEVVPPVVAPPVVVPAVVAPHVVPPYIAPSGHGRIVPVGPSGGIGATTVASGRAHIVKSFMPQFTRPPHMTPSTLIPTHHDLGFISAMEHHESVKVV
jgi:hypothetical protein